MTPHKKRLFALALCIAAVPVLGGCALPLAGALATASDLVTGVSVISTLINGKGSAELAMDLITGKDCRFEGFTRDDRDFCEEPGSPATEKDFKGISTLIAMVRESQTDGEIFKAFADVAPEDGGNMPDDTSDAEADAELESFSLLTTLEDRNVTDQVSDFGIDYRREIVPVAEDTGLPDGEIF